MVRLLSPEAICARLHSQGQSCSETGADLWQRGTAHICSCRPARSYVAVSLFISIWLVYDLCVCTGINLERVENQRYTGAAHLVCRNQWLILPPVWCPEYGAIYLLSRSAPGRASVWSLVTLWSARGCGLIVIHSCLICSLVRKIRGSLGSLCMREWRADLLRMCVADVLYCTVFFFFFLHKRGCKTDNTREDRTFKIIQKVCKNIWRRFWQQVFGLCVCSCTKWRHFCYSSQLESSVKGLWLGFIVKVRTGYSMSLWAPTTFTGERK